MSENYITQVYSDQLSTAEKFYKDIRSALRRLRARSDQLKYSRAFLSWLASISILLMGWFLLGGVLHIPAALRIPIIIILAGCGIWMGYIFIFKAFTRRNSIERIAFRIEERYPEIQDRLISSLQLWPERQDNKYGYSLAFIDRLIQEAHASLGGVDKSQILSDDIRRFKKAVIAAICAILPLIIMIAIFPSTFASSLYSLAHPLEGLNRSLIEITRVSPGDCILSPGDSVEISAEVTGPVQSTAILNYKIKDGEWSSLALSRKEELWKSSIKYPRVRGGQAFPKLEESTDGVKKTFFIAGLQNIREYLEYYVSVDGVKSRQYSITVVSRPIISSLKLELQYPKYTGLPVQSLDTNVGDVAAPLGTKVLIKATSSKDAASAFVVFDDKTTVRLEVSKSRELMGSFIIKQSGTYYISLTDTDNQTNSEPIKYSINALADQPPRVNIIQPGADVEIGKDMAIPLQIEAQDDYGVAKVSLYYQIQGEDKKEIVPLGSYSDPETNILLSHTWDLSPLKLFPDDIISYYAEVADADNVSGPNIGRSSVFTAYFPSAYDTLKQAESEQMQQQLEMEDIRSRQDDVKEMVDKLASDLKREKELDWAGKKELERAAELQKQIQDQIQDLAQQVNETVDKIKENPLISMEALEKLQELKKIMNELATEEMRQIMKKLSEALEKMTPSQQQRDLMAASFKQEEFIEKLDRMIDLFKMMQLKQKLEAAAKQAEELVKQQTETLEQSEKLAKNGVNDEKDQTISKTLGERETRIKSQTEKLLDDLNSLSDEMNERSPDLGEMMKSITERAQKSQIPEQLQCAASELKGMKPERSLTCQRNALSKLSQLQSDLQAANRAMQGQDASEIISALQDAVRKSLHLSYRYEEIMQATEDFKGVQENMLPKEKKMMDSMAAEQMDLSEGAKKVADQLRELSHRTTAVDPELVWNMDRVTDGMTRSATAMEDKNPALAGPIQKNTLSTLNSAIQDMLESMDKVNSQAMPMAGMEDFMEQLRQLAEQQSQLNQLTQDADNMQRKQGITPSLEQMLEKLATEQALIREATERLAEKLDQLAETLGRLDEVAREMQEVEDDLQDGTLSRDTLDKQRRILTRLLEYEKSMKREDFSRKREAQTGRDYAAERPKSILPDDATKIRQQVDIMLSPKAQEKWPAQYRDLIRMYYKALSKTVKTQKAGQ